MIPSVALLGFATLSGFLALILLTRVPVLVALIVVPLAAGIAGGFGADLDRFAIDGIRTVGPVAAMIMFAVLYFGLMIDAGLFEPVVRRLLRLVREDPVRLCLVTALMPMLVALDGDGATTFLISVTALLPIHRHMKMNPLVLPGIIALSAGVMNLLPWGGPTARAMAALRTDVTGIFVPVIPAMLAGIAWVFLAAWFIGRRERLRLASAARPSVETVAVPSPKARAGGLFWFNAALTSALIILLFQGLYAKTIGSVPISPALLFMVAFAIAWPVNCRSREDQQRQLAVHAANAVLVTTMILAAGVFTGILAGTGMIKAMAGVLAASIPPSLSPWFAQIVALSGMPLSLVFTPDAFYFGVLPVFAETASAMGQDPLTIGRAAILGQMTTGFPLSPLTASTFILIGLSEVTLRDHQRFVFKWAFGTTAAMTIVAWATGAI